MKATFYAGTDACAPEGLAFRVYTFKEISLLYFPDCVPHSASRRFSNLLRRDPELWSALVEAGFGPRKRLLTPAQTEVLLSFLGKPEDFVACCRRA